MKVSKKVVVLSGIALTIMVIQVVQQMMPHCPVSPTPRYGEALAVPAFARKYHVSCAACHAGAPRLNPFGEAFRLNGFRWPNPGGFDKNQTLDKSIRVEQPVPLTSDSEKVHLLKSPGLIYGDIPMSFPSALRSTSSIRTFEKGQPEIDQELELHVAGTIGNKITIFGHFNFHQISGEDQQIPMTMSMFMLQIQYRNLFNSSLLNLGAGMVGIEDNGLPNIRDHSTQRQMIKSPFFYSEKIIYPSSVTFNKEDVLQFFRRGPGFRLSGNVARWRYNLGYQMGQQGLGGTKSNEVYYVMAAKIGGMDYYGKPPEKTYTYPWFENSLQLGAIVKYGNTNIIAPNSLSEQVETKDHYWRAGFDAHAQLGKFSTKFGYVVGTNNDPYGAYAIAQKLQDKSVSINSYVIWPEYWIAPWLKIGAWYEKENMTYPTELKLGNQSRARIVPDIQIMITPNLRVGLEAYQYTQKRLDAKGNTNPMDQNQFNALIDFTF